MIINLMELGNKLLGYRTKIKESDDLRTCQSNVMEMVGSCEQAAQVIYAQRERYVAFVVAIIPASHQKICHLENCACIGVTLAKLTKAEWQLAIKLGYKSELQ